MNFIKRRMTICNPISISIPKLNNLPMIMNNTIAKIPVSKKPITTDVMRAYNYVKPNTIKPMSFTKAKRYTFDYPFVIHF